MREDERRCRVGRTQGLGREGSPCACQLTPPPSRPRPSPPFHTRRPASAGAAALSRLQVVLAHDRTGLDEQTMAKIRTEIQVRTADDPPFPRPPTLATSFPSCICAASSFRTMPRLMTEAPPIARPLPVRTGGCVQVRADRRVECQIRPSLRRADHPSHCHFPAHRRRTAHGSQRDGRGRVNMRGLRGSGCLPDRPARVGALVRASHLHQGGGCVRSGQRTLSLGAASCTWRPSRPH
jgi:hypothetical protein